jgi:N-acetylneuraminate synthase
MTERRVFIIAEAGVNHNGDLDKALLLVDAAADAGADCVKFQTFRADSLASASAAKATYQQATTDAAESQLDMLRRLELPHAWHLKLMERCEAQGLVFLSTPFDLQSLAFLADELRLDLIKLGSGELTNAPLLYAAGRTGRKLIVSTGMGTLAETEAALGAIACGCLGQAPGHATFAAAITSAEGRHLLAERVTLLHCVTEYPSPEEDCNLRAMATLRGAFGLRTGYSDHTLGSAIPIAAAALGAEVIEKHVTLDRTLPGPDHRASLEPAELKQMVVAIRHVESALGDGMKAPRPSEAKNMTIARKSLVAARAIKAGELFTAENVTTKRPGNGRSPFDYWEVIGQPAARNYSEDEVIT